MNDSSRGTTVSPDAAAQMWPPPRQAWYAVGVMTVALMFNFLDRGILNLLIEPIKRDMGLSDTQVSVIVGFAFIAFYVIVGFPIARLVDRYSRRLILGLGIAMWSGMTAACGLAQSFWQLFVARVGVGIGEACNGPSTFSLMADLFPREKLPKAISVLNIGFAYGQGIALLVGGTVIGAIANLPEITLPVLGLVRPWQLTFFAVGIPGLIVAAMMATVKEPARRGAQVAAAGPGVPPAQIPVREVIRYIVDHRAAYGPMFLGLAVQGMMVVGIIAWTPSFFIRTHGWSIAQFGQVFGLILMIITPLGLLCGGWLAERLTRQGLHDTNMRIVTSVAVLILPMIVGFPLVSSPWAAIGLLAVQNFIAAWAIGPQNAAFQVITPNRMRGQVTALFLFLFNFVGFGLGPTFIAVITDYVFGSEDQLRYSMALAAIVMEPLAAWIFWKGMKPYGEIVARA
jgi:MFS family permease